jgi:hypothetical protein
MIVPESSCSNISVQRLANLAYLIFVWYSVPWWQLEVDRFGKIALDKCGVEVDGSAFESLSHGEDKKEANSAPIDDWREGALVFSKDLQVTGNHEASF